MSLGSTLSSIWHRFQGCLFPALEEEVGSLSEKHEQLVMVLDRAQIERCVAGSPIAPGRPLSERRNITRALIAKAVFQVPTTVALIDRLHCDKVLRRLCGWERKTEIPSGSTFSRAFAEFSASDVITRIHAAMVKETFKGHVVGHISRDSTAIHAREKPASKPAPEPSTAPKRRRGRPRKDETVPPKTPSVIEQQAAGMSLQEMLRALPTQCDVGTKRNAKGYKTSWTGYKLHIDTADGDIPVSCILTSASVHDSQACIPLALITQKRLNHCYDLMDSAYDSEVLRQYSRCLGHVPIIAINPRRNASLKQDLLQEAKRQALVGHQTAEAVRYKQRSSSERGNSQLQDQYGGSTVRVRGAEKVLCHLMFGIVAITALQVLRLLI